MGYFLAVQNAQRKPAHDAVSQTQAMVLPVHSPVTRRRIEHDVNLTVAGWSEIFT